MPRISMQQAYDNRDVIAQIYKMMAEVADALEKATDAVSKALEAIEAAEDAGEAAEAAQEAVAGKQDALTAEQLAAVDSGITAEGVAQIGELDERTEILASTAEANVGDVLLLDENKDPSWEQLITGYEYETTKTHNIGSGNIKRDVREYFGFMDEYSAEKDYLILFTLESPIYSAIYPIPSADNPFWAEIMANGTTTRVASMVVYSKPGTGQAIMIPSGYITYLGSGTNKFLMSGDNASPMMTYQEGALAPKPRTADVGKFLKSTGTTYDATEWADVLPTYTSADAGKVLSINSNGELEWITLP